MKFNIVVFDTFYDKNNVTMYFDIYMIKFHNTVTLLKISFFHLTYAELQISSQSNIYELYNFYNIIDAYNYLTKSIGGITLLKLLCYIILDYILIQWYDGIRIIV